MEQIQVWCWIADPNTRESVAAALESASDLETLVGLCYSRPAQTTVLVHSEPDVPQVLLNRVISVSADRFPHDLRRALVIAFMALQAERFREQVREARHLHLRVRDAVRTVLDVNPGAKWVTPPRRSREVTTVALELGISRPTLSSLLSISRLPLGALADAWLVTWAIGLNRVAGEPWKVAARRLGFEGRSGLTVLFRRSLSEAPTEVSMRLPEAVDWFDEKLVGWLGEVGSG